MKSKLLTAKEELKREIWDLPEVVGIGIGDGCIHVYLKSACSKIPKSKCGFDVKIQVTGNIKPL